MIMLTLEELRDLTLREPRERQRKLDGLLLEKRFWRQAWDAGSYGFIGGQESGADRAKVGEFDRDIALLREQGSLIQQVINEREMDGA